jgi:hypothetical protein
MKRIYLSALLPVLVAAYADSGPNAAPILDVSKTDAFQRGFAAGQSLAPDQSRFDHETAGAAVLWADGDPASGARPSLSNACGGGRPPCGRLKNRRCRSRKDRDMAYLVFHRHPRLAGIWALLDLSPIGKLSDNRAPALPPKPRLRRDVGLPEIDPEPPIHSFTGRRF